MQTNIQAQDVLNSLFNPEETVNIRIFSDRKGEVFTGSKMEVKAAKFNTIVEELKKQNSMNRGIFYVVNYGGNTDAEIKRINAVFMECDTGTFDAQMEKINKFPLKPSMIIKTRKSLHVYWYVKDLEVSAFRPIQKALVKVFNSDPACINESRVLRLPGFNHCKEEPIEVTCEYFHPEYRYTFDNLVKVLPPLDTVTKVEVKCGTDTGLDMVIHECEFIKYCKEHATDLSEHDWYAMITNLAPFDGGVELIHKLSEPYKTYSHEVTQRKINHFLESGTRPITCKVISEKGFKCPKLESGECDCKSPAALSYKPLSIDGLNAMVDSLKVTGDALKDTKTCNEFIERYLFNQPVSIGETLIQHRIKEHFEFRGSDIKPILSFYRQLNKEHERSVTIKKSRLDDTGIPTWYVKTKSGVKFMPLILAKALTTLEHVFYAAEEHYKFAAGVYTKIDEMAVQRLVQDRLLETEAKMNHITDAEKQWRMRIMKEIREINANPFIINVKNGLYNVLEDTLNDHTPDYLSTVQLNVRYDKTADCPEFKKFLISAMEGDMEQVNLIQEILGYLLIPVNYAQKAFLFTGVARAGKSVLLRVINEILLGKQNVSNVAWQNLSERFITAELYGKLANIFSDLPTKNIDDNGIFKSLVGEDYLTVEKKNKNPFSFQSYARLLFSCNSIPKNYGDKSEGFYRRLIIIKFNRTVPVEEVDPNLISKFALEADGIFMFALEGLKKLIRNQYVFSETEKNKVELEKYKEDSDSVLSFFNDNCELDENGVIGSTELYNHYKHFCDEAGLKPYSHKSFINTLTVAYPALTLGRDQTGNRRVVKGLIYNESY